MPRYWQSIALRNSLLVLLGRIDVVKHLLANGVDVNEGLPDRHPQRLNTLASPQYHPGFTPLMAACVGGRIAVAKVLLDNGADVSQTDAKGYTALIHAAVNGEVSALKFLLANGADVNASDRHGKTALNINCAGPIHDLLKAHGGR